MGEGVYSFYMHLLPTQTQLHKHAHTLCVSQTHTHPHSHTPSSLSHSHTHPFTLPLSSTSTLTLQDRNAPSLGRFARSLSPPAPSKRSSNWKATADEDATYRTEVLHSQIPTEGDEWMAHEMRVLKEFTRIFPPEKKIPESEEMEGDDENDGE